MERRVEGGKNAECRMESEPGRFGPVSGRHALARTEREGGYGWTAATPK